MTPRAAALLAFATIVFVGLLPYAALLSHIPWGADAGKWIERATPHYDGWTTWLLWREHFIGYRPVTALSFLLNYVTTGFWPIGYRITDLALHAGVGAGLYQVQRRLDPAHPAWGSLALLVLFAHPATEEILPFVARRSYLLSAFFGCFSLVLFHDALRAARPWPRHLAAATLFALAALSNEGGYVLAPVFAAWVAVERGLDPRTLRGEWRALIPVSTAAAATLALRLAVLGSLTGGYDKHYFAFIRAGRVLWRVEEKPEPLNILGASWSYLLAPHGVTGADAMLPGLSRLIILGSLLAVIAVHRPRWGGLGAREQRVVGLLVVWALTATAIVVASGTWFWRQAYFILLPYALLVAWAAPRFVEQLRSKQYRSAALAAPLVLLAPAAALWTGPTLRGMNPHAHVARINGSELIYAIREATRDLRGPGKVLLALDVKASSAHQVRMWSERLADPSLTFKVIAHPSNQQVGAPGSFSVDTEPDGTYVVVVDPLHTELVGKEVHGQKGPTLPAESLGEPNERRWLLWFDADGAPNRVELPPDLTD